MKNKAILFIKLFRESYIFAFQAIIVNKLRTLLTLLGITIGIFSIISVFTVFDSLENKIKSSIESLGDNVLFVQKWPWEFGSDYPWWKYMNRPVAKYKELAEIEKRSQLYSAASFIAKSFRTVKYNDNSMKNTIILGVSKDYDKTMTVKVGEGRYFVESESMGGSPVAIIGTDVAKNLYNTADPIGKDISIFGRKLKVIGVFEREGDNNFGNNADQQVMVPINFFRTIVDINNENTDPGIIVRAKKGISNQDLKGELTGIMRTVRSVRPGEEDNFAINEMSRITNAFESLFQTIGAIGWIIGMFSLIVGGFGIANIMFVSVKERTPIIGIQKSLGAKNYFIMFQFLFEAVFLSILGGIIGLLIVFGGTLIASALVGFDFVLTLNNILLGVGVSFIIGIVAGIIPAFSASRLSPVEAIRFSS